MGALNDVKMKIDKIIVDKHLDPVSIRGTIGLKAGFMLAFVKPETPDDPAKLEKLKQAVLLVLAVSV